MANAYDYVKRYQEEHIANGICRDCTKPATDGIFCRIHREKYNAVSTKLRHERKKAGVCERCGKELKNKNERLCDIHRLELQSKNKKSDVALSGAMALLLNTKKINKDKLNKIKFEIQIKLSEEFINSLSGHEKIILEYRVLNEQPIALRTLGNTLEISYEWVRKLEIDLVLKLKDHLKV